MVSRAVVLSLTLISSSAFAGVAVEFKSAWALNLPALKKWLAANMSSLTSCVKGAVPTGGEVVSVRGQFSTGPALRVEKLDSAGTDVTCLKTVVEGWKNDGFQPRAGPVRFEVRFRSN